MLNINNINELINLLSNNSKAQFTILDYDSYLNFFKHKDLYFLDIVDSESDEPTHNYLFHSLEQMVDMIKVKFKL